MPPTTSPDSSPRAPMRHPKFCHQIHAPPVSHAETHATTGLHVLPRAPTRLILQKLWADPRPTRPLGPPKLCVASSKGIIIVLLYVDDMIITSSDLNGIYILKEDLNHHFEMEDLGTLSYLIGLEVFTASNGYYLSQVKYAFDLLSRAGLTDSKTTSTPLEPNRRSSGGDFNNFHYMRRARHWRIIWKVRIEEPLFTYGAGVTRWEVVWTSDVEPTCLIKNLMHQVAVLLSQNAGGEISLAMMSLKRGVMLALKILLHGVQTIQDQSEVKRKGGEVGNKVIEMVMEVNLI
ncbi:hypothetical protein RJ639_023461 [Escallonia herrerae]|uniref:Reverse transcriptase Ty1/copia-type domain-containing protein n=1 Tax=Escallonia herrerae TaxID=1293975 RepID=A0AA89ADS7_9ASTE|nr:hypothetical protein RJ639_023461 [Escallonia herrerae]